MISVYKTISNLIDKTVSKEIKWKLDKNLKAFTSEKIINKEKTIHFEIFPTLSGIAMFVYISINEKERKYIFKDIKDESLGYLMQKIIKNLEN